MLKNAGEGVKEDQVKECNETIKNEACQLDNADEESICDQESESFM